MAGESLLKDAATELAGKAIMWGPAVTGAALFGPAGIVLGLAASVVIAAKVSNCLPPGDGQAPRGRKLPSE